MLSSYLRFARYISSQFLSLRFQIRLLSISLISSLALIVLVFSNSQTRGFGFIYKLFTAGPSTIASDIGVQIKLTGLFYTIASVFETSPFWHYPDLSFMSRPQFVDYYRYIFSLIGVHNPPYIPSIYSSFGQYPICYGLLGTLSIFVILLFAYVTGKKNVDGDQDLRRFYFLYILMILFAFVKVPSANPAAWIMLSSFFVIPRNSFYSGD